MILLGPDYHTVDADVSIGSYLGDPITWAYNSGVGSGNEIYINAANGRIQGGGTPSPDVFAIAYVTNSGIPVDHEVQYNYSASSITAYPIILLRNTADTGDFYAVYQYGTVIAIDRWDAYIPTTLTTSGSIVTLNTVYAARCRAVGAGSQVDIEVWIDGSSVLTYSDTAAGRKTSGGPGLCLFYDVADTIWVDNIAIADTITPGPVMFRGA